MRPGPGVESPVRARRKSAADDGSPQQAASAGPTAFFLATESDVENRQGDDGKSEEMSNSVAEEAAVDVQDQATPKDSVFGVQSLADAMDEASAGQGEADRPQTPKSAENEGTEDVDDKMSPHLPPHPSIPGHMRARSTTVGSSIPLTPLQTMSPTTGSWSGVVPGTPNSVSLGSFRLSDADSQAGLEHEDGDGKSLGQSVFDSGPPELVMPSLALPDRRPFTERGKNMGRLRICVVGRKGMCRILLAFVNLVTNNSRCW